MNAETLLQEISDYCRRVGIAESTFGRRAVNDGKLANRLRYGGRVTLETVERVHAFMHANNGEHAPNGSKPGNSSATLASATPLGATPGPAPIRLPVASEPDASNPQQNFRFYDNRQKYLMFVNTCSEKWVVANRVIMELGNIHPRPPAIRVFDAGVGEGTVLARVMRSMHSRFPFIPFYVVGKEISLEDVRLALDKMPDRFMEHPATVLVMTNLYYAEAPWLMPKSVAAATSMVWHEVALRGDTAAEFDEQIAGLQPFLAANWRAHVSEKSGNPVYDKPVVLVIYREDNRFLLDQVRPRRSMGSADFDLVIASQPYRARASAEFKAEKVIAPLAQSLAPGGRLIGIHSSGNDPGLEIIRRVWPDESPFQTDRHEILRVARAKLGTKARRYNFNSYSDARSHFRYEMHTLPDEIGSIQSSIGTSTLLAAWNAATYVAQVEDHRLAQAMRDNRYLEATAEILQRNGGLWFWDESYVISRKRDVL